jgi:hypothetical protein
MEVVLMGTTEDPIYYITLVWQEYGEQHQLCEQQRQVYVAGEHPSRLSCSKPVCKDGGFEIGERIDNLLTAGYGNEQNSLICRNAIHPDRTKRCRHTIIYSIARICPLQHIPAFPAFMS